MRSASTTMRATASMARGEGDANPTRLERGTAIRVHDQTLQIGRVLGQGGEGVVYEVIDGADHPVYALKWYFEQTAVKERRRTLGELVERGAPHLRFLWPLGLI